MKNTGKLSLRIILTVFILTAISTASVSADEITVREITLEMKYDYISYFIEELAAVSKNGKYGYIDRTGRLVIPLEYSYAGDFNNGAAMVAKYEGEYIPYDEYFYIDKNQNVISRREYKGTDPYSEDLLAVRNPDNYKWGYIDRAGTLVIPYKYESAGNFKEGLARTTDGYINKTGELVIPFEGELEGVTVSGDFSEGMAGVSKRNGNGYISGYIDKTGSLAVPFIYDSHAYNRPFKEGLAPVLKGGKWGYIDKTGGVVIPFEYIHAEGFYEGVAVVMKLDSKGYYHGFLDTKGNFISCEEYAQVTPIDNGLILVRKDDEELLEALRAETGYIYDSGWNYSKWGYIDKKGKVIVPVEYEYPQNYSEGLIIVKKDGKYCIMQVVTKKNIEVTFGATRYVLNGEPFDEHTMVYSGTAYLPAAYLAAKLGLTAEWNAETNITALNSTEAKLPLNDKTAVIPAANPTTKNITAVFGATKYILNGEAFAEQTIVYNGTAYLPAAYLAKKLGLTAQWDAEKNITALTSITD